MEGSGQLNAQAATHTEKEPGTHWVESCVGPIVDLDVWKKWKIPPRNSTSNRPDGNQVTIPTAVSCLTEDSSYPETLSSSPVDQPKPYSSRLAEVLSSQLPMSFPFDTQTWISESLATTR